MIAPTNCNPDCDCAQRMVRCERAGSVDRDYFVEHMREYLNDLEKRGAVETVITGTPSREPIGKYEIKDARIIQRRADASKAIKAVRDERLHGCLVRAFRTCELDCGMWSDNALDELASIAIAVITTLENT